MGDVVWYLVYLQVYFQIFISVKSIGQSLNCELKSFVRQDKASPEASPLQV